jgi:hypothetical protein
LSDNLYDLVRVAYSSSSRLADSRGTQYRFLPEPGVDTYDIVVTHEGASTDFAVTVRAFGNAKMDFAAGPPPLTYSREVRDPFPLNHPLAEAILAAPRRLDGIDRRRQPHMPHIPQQPAVQAQAVPSAGLVD